MSVTNPVKASSAGESDEAGNIFRVGVKIPPFWPEEPALWFAQLEGQFLISNITTDTTKFYYVVSQLDYNIAAEVKDVIISPPDSNKYIKLKTELINRLSESHEKKIKQLLIHEELGDRKPSQFLRHLQSLAGPNVPNDFLKTIWASRLPPNIQAIIASQADISLEALAVLADRIHEVVPSNCPQVAAACVSTPPTDTTLDQMSKRMSELSKQVAALSAEVRNFKHDQPRRWQQGKSRNRSRSRSRSRSRQHNDNYCWYHNNFGSKAHKCSSPCSFKKENTSGSR